MRERFSVVLATLLLMLAIVGCGKRLSKTEARSVLEEPYEANRGKGEAPAPHGFYLVYVGSFEGMDKHSDGCSGHDERPDELIPASDYAKDAGLIEVIRPRPCSWDVRVPEAYVADLVEGSVSDGTAEFVLSRFNKVEVTGIKQDGLHADVSAVMHFGFTSAMDAFARIKFFPKGSGNCRYELPTREIECFKNFTLTFYDGKWQLDASNDQ